MATITNDLSQLSDWSFNENATVNAVTDTCPFWAGQVYESTLVDGQRPSWDPPANERSDLQAPWSLTYNLERGYEMACKMTMFPTNLQSGAGWWLTGHFPEVHGSGLSQAVIQPQCLYSNGGTGTQGTTALNRNSALPAGEPRWWMDTAAGDNTHLYWDLGQCLLNSWTYFRLWFLLHTSSGFIRVYREGDTTPRMEKIGRTIGNTSTHYLKIPNYTNSGLNGPRTYRFRGPIEWDGLPTNRWSPGSPPVLVTVPSAGQGTATGKVPVGVSGGTPTGRATASAVIPSLQVNNVQTEVSAGATRIARPGTWGNNTIPKLEGTFSYNGIVLNDLTQLEHYRVISVSGLSFPDIKVSEQKKPESFGMSNFEALEGGRQITITGIIEAFNLSKMKEMVRDLRAAFADLTEKPLYIDSDWTNRVFIRCRKVAPIAIRAEQGNDRYRRAFQVDLRASDPRIYGDTVKQIVMALPTVGPASFIPGTDNEKNLGNFWAPTIWRVGRSAGNWSMTNAEIVARNEGYGFNYKGTMAGSSGSSVLEVDSRTGVITTVGSFSSFAKKNVNSGNTNLGGMMLAPFSMVSPSTLARWQGVVSSGITFTLLFRDTWL